MHPPPTHFHICTLWNSYKNPNNLTRKICTILKLRIQVGGLQYVLLPRNIGWYDISLMSLAEIRLSLLKCHTSVRQIKKKYKIIHSNVTLPFTHTVLQSAGIRTPIPIHEKYLYLGLYTGYHRVRMVNYKDFTVLDYRTLLNSVHFNMFYLFLGLHNSLYPSHLSIKILQAFTFLLLPTCIIFLDTDIPISATRHNRIAFCNRVSNIL